MKKWSKWFDKHVIVPNINDEAVPNIQETSELVKIANGSENGKKEETIIRNESDLEHEKNDMNIIHDNEIESTLVDHSEKDKSSPDNDTHQNVDSEPDSMSVESADDDRNEKTTNYESDSEYKLEDDLNISFQCSEENNTMQKMEIRIIEKRQPKVQN